VGSQANRPRDDSDIATAIAHVLDWNVQIPENAVHARVEDGWVTLDGEVEHDYQRREVERMVGPVRGVLGVTNAITLRPPATSEQVEHVIENAFRREAQVDARHIKIEVSGRIAKLYGNVHSMHELTAATTAAATAPGITMIENHLVVTP
jgi:osmotically-inducible protein OsmY